MKTESRYKKNLQQNPVSIFTQYFRQCFYNAPTKEAALLELDMFEQKWGAKYPYAIRSWRANWDELTSFFDFPVEIRKIIYTTNLIENLNGKIRKYTKNKLSFPNDEALKSLFIWLLARLRKMVSTHMEQGTDF